MYYYISSLINTAASARNVKAAWDMIIAAVVIMLEKAGGSYGGY